MPARNPMPTVDFEWTPTPVEVLNTFERLGKTLQSSFVSDLERAGYDDDLAELIRNRTREGISSTGRRFEPYSAFTVLVRSVVYGLGSSVDLSVSGSMLEAIKGRRKGLRRNAIELFLQGSRNQRVGLWQHKGTKARGVVVLVGDQLIGIPGERRTPGIPARPFMGLRSSDEVLATAIAEKIFQAVTVPRLISDVARSFR